MKTVTMKLIFLLGVVFILSVVEVVDSRVLRQPWKIDDDERSENILEAFQDDAHYLQARQPIAYGKRRSRISKYVTSEGPVQPIPYHPRDPNEED